MARTLDGEQTYYECTECGATVSAGEVQAHESEHYAPTNISKKGNK